MSKQVSESVIVDQYQVAIFPVGFPIPNPAKMSFKLAELEDIFDSNTLQLMPVADQAPPEIIRIELSNTDKSFSLKVSKKKIDFFWTNVSNLEGFTLMSDWKNRVEQILEACDLSKSALYDRVGYITHLYKVVDDPAKSIGEALLTLEQPELNSLTSINTTLTFKKTIEGTRSNISVIIADGYKTDDPDKKLIGLQYDQNTHQDVNLRWKRESVFSFIETVKADLDPKQIFKQFIPNEQ